MSCSPLICCRSDRAPETSFKSFATSNNGNDFTYLYGLSSGYGPFNAEPAFARFLFQCEFNLFDLIPASGAGVWTPAKNGLYSCDNGLVPGTLQVNWKTNPIGYGMNYHDLAFVVKVLHDANSNNSTVGYFSFAFQAAKGGSSDYYDVMSGTWAASP